MNSNEQVYRFNQVFFQKKAQQNYQTIIELFQKSLKSFYLFNLGFWFFFVMQFLCFILSFALLNSSTLPALLLASLFLSCFTYFVLLYYYQAKKPQFIHNLKNDFVQTCKKALSLPNGSAEHHLTISLACLNLSEAIKKNCFIKIPKVLSNFVPRVKTFLFEEDLFNLQEVLLLAAIEEHLQQLKQTPTDLELHTSLANIYTNLSYLYQEGFFKTPFAKTIKTSLKQKHDFCINQALEEFKILNDYAPNDPWIHLQLAQSYKKLNLKKYQIKELEIVYRLCPNDNNILFQLGILYFENQRNSKGLRIYEELKMRSFKDADKLLAYYGASKIQEIFEESI